MPAVCVPKLCVPMAGVPIDCQIPAGLILGVRLCDRHFRELAIAEWPDGDGADRPGLRAVFEAGARTIPFDFARAYFSAVSLRSPEFRRFEGMRTGQGSVMQ